MAEKALATPLESDEIIEIARDEFTKRLRGLSPLYSRKLYNAFVLDFNVSIRLIRASGEAVTTLAWGDAKRGEVPADVCDDQDSMRESYVSKEPNVERMERDMPVTVEDKKGGPPKKVRVKDMKAKK